MSVGALKGIMGHTEFWIDYAQYMWRFVSEKVAKIHKNAPEESITEADKAEIASYWQYLNVFRYNGMSDGVQLSPAALDRETGDWLLHMFRCCIAARDPDSRLYEDAVVDLYNRHEGVKQWVDAGEARRKACATARGYDCWDCEYVHENRCTVDEQGEEEAEEDN